MNKIIETQLEPTQLKRLAAQRQLYSDAKVIQAVQIKLCVLGPPILAVLVACNLLPAVWAAICGITIACFFLLFDSQQKSLKEKAAKIQELFDCDVLELNWREIMVGPRIEIETVEKYASKHRREDPDYLKLKDWYSNNVGKLPLHLGRIVCQRSNCWWDAQLRRRYVKWVIGVFFVVLIVVVTCFGLAKDWSLEQFILLVVNPLTPVFILGVRQYNENTKSAMRLDKLKEHAEKIWNRALRDADPEELTRASRDLQDEIYHHRRTNSPIFDWFYNLLKKEDEEQMNKSADELVNEALKTLQK